MRGGGGGGWGGCGGERESMWQIFCIICSWRSEDFLRCPASSIIYQVLICSVLCFDTRSLPGLEPIKQAGTGQHTREFCLSLLVHATTPSFLMGCGDPNPGPLTHPFQYGHRGVPCGTLSGTQLASIIALPFPSFHDTVFAGSPSIPAPGVSKETLLTSIHKTAEETLGGK